MEEKYIERIAYLESLAKENNQKINEQNERISQLEKNYSIMEKMDYRIGRIESSIEKIQNKLFSSDNKKAGKWEKFVDYIFYAIVAYALVKLGLK